MAASHRSRTGLVAAVALLLLSGCGQRTGDVPPDSPPSSDLDGSWVLVSGHDVDGRELEIEDRPITLDVSVADGELGGVSACNQYFASLHEDEDLVEVYGVGGTEMACEPEVMDLEQRYLASLPAVDHAAREGDRLTLSGHGAEMVFEAALPPRRDSSLVATTWRLESLIEGESVSSTVAGGRLVLAADGSLVATTGCGTASGSYVLRGRDVEVSGLEAGLDPTARCTEQAVAQHEHMVDVLREGFSAKVEGDRLTVTDENGLGLGFRAR